MLQASVRTPPFSGWTAQPLHARQPRSFATEEQMTCGGMICRRRRIIGMQLRTTAARPPGALHRSGAVRWTPRMMLPPPTTAAEESLGFRRRRVPRSLLISARALSPALMRLIPKRVKSFSGACEQRMPHPGGQRKLDRQGAGEKAPWG